MFFVVDSQGSGGSSSLTQEQVKQLGEGMNTKATVALTSGIPALGGVATWLFVN